MLQNALLMQQMALMGPELMQQMSMMGPEFMQQMAMMSPELMQTMALMGPDAFNALLLGGTNNSPNNGIEVRKILIFLTTISKYFQKTCIYLVCIITNR